MLHPALLTIVLLITRLIPAPQGIRGTITTDAGDPLVGVEVLGMQPDQWLKTDSKGEFLLREISELIRFSLPGYRPVTIRGYELLLDSTIHMKPDPKALWIPGDCSVDGKEHVMSGGVMRFTLPGGTQFLTQVFEDHNTNTLCKGKYCLKHGWGALWGLDGVPSSLFFANLIITEERDIEYQPMQLPGFEYRGVKADGTRSRWDGIVGESIGYEDVPRDIAQFFDSVIDSLCWIDRRRK